MRRSLAFANWVCSVCALVLIYPVAFAEDTAPSAPVASSQLAAYQSSVAEESVRKDTDKVQAEINQLLAELKANGLSQKDALLLANAAGHLKSLSQDDMQKVVNTLQSASLAAQEQDRQKSLVTAFQDQGAVTLKLKSLAAQLAVQEAQRELPSKLEDLIVRQSANIRQTSKLPNVKLPQLNPGQGSLHGVVSSEQTSIEGEINLLYQSVSTQAGSPPADGSSSDLTKSVLDAMNAHTIQYTAGEATQTTAKGPFPEAVFVQKSLREYLSMVLRTALSKTDVVGKLQQAKTELDQIASDQKNLADEIKQSKIDGKTLAERQADLNDRTAAAQALLNTSSPQAASQLDPVQQAMQKSSDALDKTQNTADTAPQQQAVAQALDGAQAALDQQLASAQKAEDESPLDKLAQLQQLQDALTKAEQDPKLTAADLQKLQEQAADLSTPASDKILDAQDTLKQNTPDPTQSQPPPDPSQPPPSPDQNAPTTAAGQPNSADPNAPPQQNPNALSAQQSQQNEQNEQAADKLLAQAGDDIKQQVDAAKAAAQAYQALSQASQQLSQAQQQTQDANKALDNSSQLSNAAHDLAQAQASVDQAQQSSSPSLSAETKAAMQKASDALKDGAMQAVQTKAGEAKAAGQRASGALQEAQSGLAQAMAQVQQSMQSDGQRQSSEMADTTQPVTNPGQDASHGERYDGPILGSHSGLVADGSAQVMGGLKPKDRAAIAQMQEEKSPPEYAAQIQQYMKNLADASESR